MRSSFGIATRFVALLTPGLLASCGAPAPVGQGGQIELIPTDLTSNVRADIQALVIVDYRLNPNDGRNPEAYRTEVLTLAGSPVPARERDSGAALPDGWYVATLAIPADDVGAFVVVARQDGADGTRYTNRFHVGPAPVLTVEAEALPSVASPDAWRVLVEGSESLALLSGAGDVSELVTISSAGREISCTRVVRSPDVAQELRELRGLEFSCPDGLSRTEQISVRVAPGLVSEDGSVPLRDPEGRDDCLVEWQVERDGTRAPVVLSEALLALTDSTSTTDAP